MKSNIAQSSSVQLICSGITIATTLGCQLVILAFAEAKIVSAQSILAVIVLGFQAGLATTCSRWIRKRGLQSAGSAERLQDHHGDVISCAAVPAILGILPLFTIEPEIGRVVLLELTWGAVCLITIYFADSRLYEEFGPDV